MKLVATPEDELERAASQRSAIPSLLMSTLAGPLLGRSIQVALEKGVFNALEEGPRTAQEVARACSLAERGTTRLLDALATTEWLKRSAEHYELTELGRDWVLGVGRSGYAEFMLVATLEWSWHSKLAEYLRTDRGVDIHGTMSPRDWKVYVRGNYAAHKSDETSLDDVPVPPGARRMLDIGGSHGFFAVLFCRRYPDLQVDVFDLPGAVEAAAPLFARENALVGNRMHHVVGDARTYDFGDGVYDIITLCAVVHIFDEATNESVIERAARALKPGGLLVIGDGFREERPSEGGQLGAFFYMLFGLVSDSAAWTPDQMAKWQRDAGLEPMPEVRLTPRSGFQMATKPAP